MAYNNEQNEPSVPINNAEARSSSNLIPQFFRTNENKKFLNATVDQLIQPGAVKKINGYIGRSNAKSAVSSDIQIEAVDKARQDYQLEPAAVIKDYLGNTTFYKDYIDHINHIHVFGGNVDDHSRLNKQEFYSWNPHIDWDKFVNFQQYYWLPYGPDVIKVSGQQKEIISTYTVEVVDEEDNYAYLFTPNGLTRNPTLRLFRGQTYIFDINAEGHPFSIKRRRTEGTLDRYNVGVSENAVEVGQIVFEVPDNAPDVLFYVSENAVDTGGVLQILDIEENTFLDVGQDILGKKTYTVPDVLGNPLPFSNGMKVEFIGEITPAEYGEGYWYIEGVGTAIKLINEKELQVRSSYTESALLNFDDVPFDQLPFSEYGNFPSRKDYITINRSSPDSNIWSRYNRWFHKDVIETSARVNFKEPDINQSNRATRPIIEFVPGIKLYNHGVKAKKSVDIIDNFTKDAFSTVEGSIGYNVDGIELIDKMRIIFNADTDILVKNKIYLVNFITVNIPGKTLTFNAETQVDLDTNSIVFTSEHGLSTLNQITYLDRTNVPIPGLVNRQVYYVKTVDPFRIELFKDKKLETQVEIFNISSGTHAFEVFLGRRKQIHLTEEPDAIPQIEDSVAVNLGKNERLLNGLIIGNQGQTYWFNGDKWLLSQPKLNVNQPPLFDIFDSNENSYGDVSVYEGSSFKGNKIFSYKIGTGTPDKELEFPLSYQNINNVGDIVFNFDLLTDSFEYKVGNDDILSKRTDIGYLKITNELGLTRFENGWTTSEVKDYQPVVRVYKGTEKVNDFAIDTFSNVNDLEDLKVKVYVNGKILKSNVDYIVETRTVYKYVVLNKDIKESDIVTIKSYTKQKKNSRGFYEFPINLQNNPLNNNVETFTLGEVLNHVESIVDNLDNFQGSFPGNNNLRDLGSVEKFGTRFVQHSGSLNLALYHLGNKDANIIKALDRARDDYGKFKRSFLLEAEKSSFFGSTRDHVSNILQKINANRPKSSPYYLSDMFAYGANNTIQYTVLDGRIKKYPLTVPFNLKSLSNRAVNIYLNGEHLSVDIDYTLGDDEFFEILRDLNEGDVIETIEWETTDGSFCPATPSKLGIYPAYEPKIYIDDTYVPNKETIKVPNGNDNLTFKLDNINKFLKSSDIRVEISVPKFEDLNDPKKITRYELEVYEYFITIEDNSCFVTFYQSIPSQSIIDFYIPVVVIQGHDGSKTISFDDYKDDLLLELEKRIFNNIKVKYNSNIFDVLNYIPGYTRNTDYSREEFNKIIAPAFFSWLQLIGKDFTKNINFDQNNEFTFNLKGTYTPNNKDAPKYWRGVYRWLLDTDSPHIAPWECLGYSIKPMWWEEVYGHAPYTKDNLILWDDIRQGIIRDPNKLLVRNEKVAKGILEFGVPVDELGRLVAPFDSKMLKGYTLLPEANEFIVGDGSPIESAWVKSSYYPFGLIRACLLMNPSDCLSRTFDRSRIILNKNKQLVYKDTNLRLKLKDILVPSTANSNDSSRVMTAGLINYIVDYLSSENLKKLKQYKSDLKLLTNNISTRLASFTSKPKYKVLLDSKNPNATSGVFVPEENYRVELNVSSPIKRLSYSGVVVTKSDLGYEVKGYDIENQYFTTYPYRTDLREINVGGISESYLIWEPDRTYVAGKVIRFNDFYYRVKITHKTSDTFDNNFYAQLSELPIVGGRTARLRKDWDFSSPIIVPYNTILPTIQDVVDLLQGYGEFLKQEGFVFEEFNNNLSTITDWITSIKEFLFWTTQNWAVGSAISLSPSANKLVYKSKNSVVDNVKDQFYNYLIFKVDGKKLEPEYINAYRSKNTFELTPSDTNSGIYCAVLYLVQKEHVVILDDRTIFNDVIYDSEAGFRQERLKVVGYTTVNWTGGFEIPGFLFDQVKILDWEPWTDYNLGDIVKYKEFFYSARKFLPGVETFNTSDWYLIEEQLESRLLPNWDYRTEQFTDFYDLDTDNFDSGQQRVAQHTIGYQKRQYLENIINNDVSQYKFYQGMIAEKGTLNVLNKLFDVLSSRETESLTFNEEWAIRVGDYGAVDAFDEVEIQLDEKQFKVNPQPLEITNLINPNLVDFVYRQRYNDLYIKPSTKFTTNIFETSTDSNLNYLRKLGYVREQDLLASVDTLDSLLTVEEVDFREGDYVHTAFEGADWNVYKLVNTGLRFLRAESAGDGNIFRPANGTRIYCDKIVPFAKGSYVRLFTFNTENFEKGGFYKVIDVINNSFVVNASLEITQNTIILIFILEKQRIEYIDDLNDLIYSNGLKENEIVWVDFNKKNYWATYKNTSVYSNGSIVNQDSRENLNFGKSISISGNGNVCVVSSNRQITVYEKASTTNFWRSIDRFTLLDLPDNFKINGDPDEAISFGSFVSLSKDAEWLAISAPEGHPFTYQNVNQGFLQLFKRQINGKYASVPIPDTFTAKQFTESNSINYGKNVKFSKTPNGYLMAVSAVNTVYVYRYVQGNQLGDWELINTFTGTPNSEFGKNIDFSDKNNTLVISSHNDGQGKVVVYDYDNVQYILLQELTFESTNDYKKFGFSAIISENSEYIAVGSILKNNRKFDSGAVFVYKKSNTTYELYQTLTSIKEETNEQFGHKISFMNNDETLVVYSANSDSIRRMKFDSNTTFDKNSTKFSNRVVDTGRIDIYDRYDTKFAYGETLSSLVSPADRYGSDLAVGSNCILVSSIFASDQNKSKSGKVYSYTKPVNKFSWELLYEQIPDVDVSKIKKAYIYNKRTNELVTYLDVIDVKQGKIPGIADQEIKFKTYYDPAIYSRGNELVNVDDGLAWQTNHVGQLWWDLTRAKFVENSLGDLLYKSINWNILYKTASIDIYEWVESNLLPSQWDELADTEEGLALGISGITRYGDNVYSVKSYYDPISQSVKSLYYYWVKNKKIVPNIEGRNLSASNVSRLIADPTGYGYPCISFNSDNSLNLVNLEKFTQDKDIVLNIQQWLVDNRTNYHSEWKLITATDATTIPTYIEQKWFHSLVGKDERDRVVPDLSLPAKQRYGVEFKPRQGMFINRIEPLKQLVDSVNRKLKTVLLTDIVNLSNLELSDPIPNEINCLWDNVIDSEKELRFISTVNFELPKIIPKVVNGKIIELEIENKGIGYSRYRTYSVNVNQEPIKWYGPDIIISGQGSGAKIKSIIDRFGSVVGYEILSPGEGYLSNTTASMRSTAVLIKSDSTSFDGWAIYTWDNNLKEWQKTKSQAYNVNRYWKYIDWYKEGFNEFTAINYLVDNTYQLVITEMPIGSVVKIKNIGSGGWSLLRKINDINTIDYTENFETIGRQNGTIEFLSNIYRPNKSYDDVLLDTTVYDNYPVEELRIILKSLRDDILIGEYRSDYINLFLESVKYVLNEQIFADWVFKSSFIKAQHNLGELTQRPNYKNDSLEDFEKYINEVKPYRTKVREFVSSYNSLDTTNSVITDFDVLPVIEESKKVTPLKLNIEDKQIISNENSLDISSSILDTYPWKNWFDNVGFEITEVAVVDPGEGYISNPKIEFIGDQLPGGLPAIAKAYISKGSIRKIVVTNPGSRWIKPPQVKITGTVVEGGRAARAISIIGNSLIRSNNVQIRFDRLSKVYQVSNLEELETFSGDLISGSRTQFQLKWSPNLDNNKYTVVLNGAEILKSEYKLTTVVKKINGSSRYSGLLTFNTPPTKGSVITINYCKNFDHLDAVDRINFFYDPQTGQLGKDLSLLMTGIDYGGVSVTGLDFKNTYGWDALPWVSEVWDAEIPNFEDHIITISDANDREFRLPYVPEEGEEITVYISKLDFNSSNATYLQYLDPVRIDDIEYPVATPENVIMRSFVGDGLKNIVVLPQDANLEVYQLSEIISNGNSEETSFTDIFDGGNSLQISITSILNGFNSNTPTTERVIGDRVIFRKKTSDGSINAREEDYDTILTGGNLAYSTATGFATDDIILDGDGLVTPMTSHAPEEVVPGQILDTLSIKVYSRPVGGAPNILFKNYVGDGSTTEFLIGQYFLNNNSVIVTVNNQIQIIEEDYTVDYQNNVINFVNPPLSGESIGIISISFSSNSILDLDYFVSDGVTVEYITRAQWSNRLNVTVLVNGQVPIYEIFTTDQQYVETNEPWRARVGIRFAVAPAQGSIINYVIDNADVEQTASVAKSEIINYNLSQDTYTLLNPVGVNLPLEPNVLVKSDSLILRGPSYTYFTMTDKNLSYSLPDSKYQTSNINSTDIKVYIDGQLKVIGKDYTIQINDPNPIFSIKSFNIIGGVGYTEGDILELEGPGETTAKFEVKLVNSVGTIVSATLLDIGKYSQILDAPYVLTGGTGQGASISLEFFTSKDLPEYTINIKKSRYKEGKKLVVGITKNSDYEFNNSNSITIKKMLYGVSRLEVLSFFNHNILGIEQTEEVFDQTPILDTATPEYLEFTGKEGGRFRLRSTVPSGDFVWVTKNKQLLTFNVDYYLEDDFQTIKLEEYPASSDVIQITAFTNTVVDDTFGFMQFKDMMNRTHYKRLNKDRSTVLLEDLKPYDRTIKVKDPRALPRPDRFNNRPGIIEINGERIEYFIVDGHELSQLRRGTLGTGIADVYPAGTVVLDVGPDESIPYKDTQDSIVITSNGNTVYQLPFVPGSYPVKDSSTNKTVKFVPGDIEVFVGGYRLKKEPYVLYNQVNGYPYSPISPILESDTVGTTKDGDTKLPPEFTVFSEDGVGFIKFETAPAIGLRIMIVRKQGKVWNELGKRLANSNNKVANFIKKAEAIWPR
jgi:hypothetical protein